MLTLWSIVEDMMCISLMFVKFIVPSEISCLLISDVIVCFGNDEIGFRLSVQFWMCNILHLFSSIVNIQSEITFSYCLGFVAVVSLIH
ncbi:hypothetical protein Leryth_001051 [Lithospermum erythrorhizon]|nr:hypothetical protein Leryth_001051 [Lithospermum erythrorhizon]